MATFGMEEHNDPKNDCESDSPSHSLINRFLNFDGWILFGDSNDDEYQKVVSHSSQFCYQLGADGEAAPTSRIEFWRWVQFFIGAVETLFGRGKLDLLNLLVGTKYATNRRLSWSR